MSTTEPMDKFKDAGRNALGALGKKAIGTVTDKVGGLTDKFEDVAGGGPIGKAAAEGGKAKAEGGSAVGGALKGAVSGVKDKLTGGGGSSSGGGKPTKSTNIIETIDVGVPLKVAYNQWTEFGSFPSFMKKVESVEAPDDNKLEFKAQIFLSHRSWEATIRSQIPDERIVWRSKGQKGHVDGAVTFHEIGPNLTRILVVLEYYSKGLFEKTGNIWEAQGRRARAELRHFRRHVMTRTLLEPDEVEGWRGRIEDGEVVESHEDAVEREEREQAEAAEHEESDEAYDEGEEPAEDAEDADVEDEYEEGEEPAEDAEDADVEDEYEEGEEPAEDVEDVEDEYEEGEDEEGEEPAEEDYEEGEEPAEDVEDVEDEYEEGEEPEDEAEERSRRRKRRAS
jgi:uncharacterized membrane protein